MDPFGEHMLSKYKIKYLQMLVNQVLQGKCRRDQLEMLFIPQCHPWFLELNWFYFTFTLSGYFCFVSEMFLLLISI